MDDEKIDINDPQKSEIDRLIEDFRARFHERTADPDDFITVHEIERMWGELLNGTQSVYSDMLRELISSQDEKELIKRKKANTPGKG